MKRFTLILLGIVLTFDFIVAGGLVTNTNQSTAWSRMLSRDATVEIDAVFYNPAGLVKLQDGFHISLSNQSIFQTRTIDCSFPYLNESEFSGSINAPLFPSLYLAYKTGRWAFSVAFNVYGGGGGAEFKKGVPMMEVPVAALVPTFADMGVTGYSVDMAFTGRSTYYGLQGGISFAVTDYFSVYAGARYIMARNTYEGYLKDITLKTDNGDVRADAFMNNVADQAEAGAAEALSGSQLAQETGDQMQPLIDLGFGDLSFDEAVGAGILTPEQAAQMEGGLLQFGFTQEEIDAMSLATGQQSFYGSSVYLSGLSTQLLQQAASLSATALVMADQEADVTQTGNGWTPIIGVNFSFLEGDVNIGAKYEFRTKMELTNSTPEGKGFTTGIDPETGEPVEMFPDGEKVNANIPAFLSLGLDWQISDPVKISFGYHYYFDRDAEWPDETTNAGGGTYPVDNNFFEVSFGLQYDINESFLVSAGYLHANTGVNEYYQSDLSYSLTSNTVGLGGAWALNETFKLQLGGYYVMYHNGTYDYKENNTGIPYQKTYHKNTWAISLGLDIALGGDK